MDKLNKGFTLLELLVVLSMITVLSLVTITRWQYSANKDNNIDILCKQVRAMQLQDKVSLNKSLYFNGNGNINQAQTLKFNHKTCTFQLGFGRFYCE